jgi:hypothetical protein
VACLDGFATLKSTLFLTSPFGKGGLGRICILIEKRNDKITKYQLIND